VDLIFEDRVARFEGEGRVRRVATSNGREVDCDFAVVGLGVEPVVEVAASAGVEVDNGIMVDELNRTSIPGIFAAGDVANHLHPVFGRRLRVEHWQHAIKHGRAAALSMMGAGAPYADVHWFWSDQYRYQLQYAGWHTEWDAFPVRGSLESRSFTGFYVKDGLVRAAVAMGRGGDVIAAMGLIASGVRVEQSALADDGVDLRTLVPAVA
jgi:3-phenylpropionate/trans-cinnamate dioxygenase ferredoxin reductase subunit